MVGANPLVSHGSVLTAPRVREQLLEIVEPAAAAWWRGSAPVRDGAPVRARSRSRPDTDAWLLLSMLHVIFDEGLATRRFLAEHTRGRGELPSMARAVHPPEETAEQTGMPAGDGARARRATAPARIGRGLRAHGLLPGPFRHAGRLPDRRAQRRHGQPRPARAARCSAARPSRSTTWARRSGWPATARSARGSATSRTCSATCRPRSCRARSRRRASARSARCSCPPATPCCRCRTATRSRRRWASST